MKIPYITGRTLLMLAAASCFAISLAQTDDMQRKVYTFRRSAPVTAVEPYSTTFYTAGAHEVTTARGDLLHENNDTVKSFQVAPTGISYMLVEKGKKNSKATLYSTLDKDDAMAKFDTKKFGTPLAATYSPDGRNVVVATQNMIYITDPANMLPKATIANVPAPFSRLFMSPNAYYLVGVAGPKVYVYNFEEKTLRSTLDVEETVTDINFSPDNTDMGVLTADGVLSLFNTRTFDMRGMRDDLGDGIAFAYNLDGKYVGVVTSPEQITVVNLLKDSDREVFDIDYPGVADIAFISDAGNRTMMVYGTAFNTVAQRMDRLQPYFGRLIADETDRKMDEWLKMMPGESMEQYRSRVSTENQTKQRAMFEYEISTMLAGDIIANTPVKIGSYDRSNNVLALELTDMPTIFIPVPENEVTEFSNPAAIKIHDVLYGVNDDDSFDIVYAIVTNGVNGKEYIYDNLKRAAFDYMAAEDAISIELLQQQQMEELKLQELRQQVLREAKSQNVISDHTNITVNSRLVPDYNANGDKILNYVVSVNYEVDPGFSVTEDFGPGKYKVNESGAASSMLKIVKEAFEGDFAPYFKEAKKLKVKITGTADATPILRGIAYDGSFGDYTDEPVVVNNQLSALSVNKKNLIKENPELAFLRALGVKDYLEKSLKDYNEIQKDYTYEVQVSEDKGSEFRRITVDFTFVDAFRD